MRLKTERGSASENLCIDCGLVAQEWSYDRQDPAELLSQKLNIYYSTNLDFYHPRCTPCHRKFDLRKDHCKNGHEYTPENTYWRPDGWRDCRSCRKQRSKDRKRKRKAHDTA